MSEGFVVLCPWTYFTRLWCVYEWACCLLSHDPMRIVICADQFVRHETLPLYANVIRDFTISKCECYMEEDRDVLERKIGEYYVSRIAFEQLLKFSVIALFARSMATRRAGRAAAALQPWVDLARDCNFPELEHKLKEMRDILPQFRKAAVKEARAADANLDIQSMTAQKVDVWFETQVLPLILNMRHAVVKASTLSWIAGLQGPS